jgi:hypothetical protein
VTVTGVAEGVRVMSTVWVSLGPSTVFVDIMVFVVGGKVSVLTIVSVVGAGVSMTVWTIVTSP